VSIKPIERPFDGERVVALSPENANAAATDWLRRPNLFPGRALTAPTLEQRQRWQAGRIAIRTQAFTRGVARGLEVSFTVEPGAGGTGGDVHLQITPGRALAFSGEDVVLPTPVDVRLLELPVVAEPAIFAQALGEAPPSAPGPGGLGVLRPRAIGSLRLGQLIAARSDILPPAGVLVLQPVVADRSDFDPTDPCDRCACAESVEAAPDSFEDWRTADGVRLLWYAWPDEWRALPPDTPRRRNALAHVVFDAEAALAHGESLPWESWGAPVALIGVDAAWQPRFIDRAAVVRHGGRARNARLTLAAGGRLAADSRLPGLWQARIEQLAEQLTEMGDPLPNAMALAQAFDRLPPAGLLPTSAINLSVLPLRLGLEVLSSGFFPASFDLDAVPVPIPQLDVAIREAAPLAAISFSAVERVRVLVPVTQASFEPRLLFEEVVAPEFQQTLDRFVLERSRALGARQGLRNNLATLIRALTGTTPTVTAFNDDPLALELESLAPWGPPPAGGGHRAPLAAGRHQHQFSGATTAVTLGEGEQLFAYVYLDPDSPPQTLMLQWETGADREHRAYWGANRIELGTDGTASRRQISSLLPPVGQWIRLTIDPGSVGLGADTAINGMAFILFDGRAAYGPTGVVGAGGDRVWFASRLPAGAAVSDDFEPWEFLSEHDLFAPFEPSIGVSPVSAEGVPAGGGHVEPAGRGQRQRLFSLSTETKGFLVGQGQSVFVWVWLDPENPPRELLLQWTVGSGNNARHQRASFGESLIASLPVTGSIFPVRRASLPALGTWVRLVVPGSETELEDESVKGMGFALFDGRAAFGAAGALAADGTETVWFSGALPANAVLSGTWTFITAEQMAAPFGGTTAIPAMTKLRADPSLATLSVRERAQLDVRGLEGFMAYLTSRADRADDLVDFGFIKVQTDVYRVRQLVLGTTAATRLAVSPALATIAQAETAVASQEQISTFYDRLISAATPTVAAMARSAGGGGSSGTPAAFEVGGTATTQRRSTLEGMAESGAPTAGAFASGPAVFTVSASGAAAQFSSSAAGAGVQLEANIRLPPATGVFQPSPGVFQPSPGVLQPSTGIFKPPAPATFETPTLQLPLQQAANLRVLTQGTGVISAGTISTPQPGDVINAAPIIGKANIRTTAIAERLKDPKAIEAKDYTAATRHDAVAALVRLAEQLRAEDGGVTPGLFDGIDVYGVRDDPFLGSENTTGRLSLHTFISDRSRLAQLLTTPVRTRPGAEGGNTLPDEGAYFSDSADLSDNTVALMRQLEGRIKLYRDVIAAAQRTRAILRDGVARGSARLTAIADALAEARHDVSVARALLAEESDRVAGINERRSRILAEEVRFLAFVRPREADNLADAPHHQVDPGLIDAPAPACLDEHPDVPDELTDMLRVVREAPAQWFVEVPRLFDRLDRPDLLLRVLQSAQLRTQLMAAPIQVAPPTNRVTGAMASMQLRQHQTISQARALATQLDLTRVQSLTWQGARDQAAQVASLGDLIDGEHGRGEVSRRAAHTFEEIERIAACLHAGFSSVLPSIRLDWAETLSQFDEAPTLRRLGALARWGEIPYADRYRIQGLTDWLFSRINAAEPRAESLMNDVVRMCLLLASHAPVGRIIAGRLPRPITVRPGVRLPVTAFDATKLRVGMEALVYRESNVVARAVVEDIGASEIATRVIHTAQPQVDLDVNVRVQFGAARSMSLAQASKPTAMLR
jgi:hypothetical protein